jgi:2-amino-4-hydroxy-6-hydroxymethyldihydropteridine diphosphokinase
MVTDSIIGIIDNSGRQLKWLSRACSKISMIADISKISSIYIDEFESDKGDGKFEQALVMALSLKCSLSSEELLKNIVKIEDEIRTEATRDVMDILILAFGDELKMTPGLTIPHPRFHLHPQLLYPAAEIMGQFVHPVLKRNLKDLASQMGLKWGRYFEQGSRVLDFS